MTIVPNDPYALNNKGNGLYSLGRYEEALQYYDKALSFDPNFSPALVNKGAALGELGRYQEARVYFEQALNQERTTTTITGASDNKEDDVILITNIADRDYFVVENLLLLQPYSNNLELGGEGNALLNNLQGYKDESELYYITTDEFLTKTDIIAQTNTGITIFQEGNYQEAMNIFDKILAIDDEHVPSLYYKGQCMEELGYLEEANQYKNMVYQIDPNYKGSFELETVATSQVIQAITPSLETIAAPLETIAAPLETIAPSLETIAAPFQQLFSQSSSTSR